ncbi:MAG TPA: diaminopimelate epimerase [Gaiellaceae bacterium]|nr:diaminopimelate epimerase [Gaiellaceae bacterium]
MRSWRWHAHGNVYIVHEGPGAGVDATGTDGVLEILAVDGDRVEIGILNTDGSRAEMSGNGTRIAGAWLMARTGSDVAHVHVGPLAVEVRRLPDGLYESELGPVEVGARETVAGVELTPVSVGNPHAVVLDEPERIAELGPLLETHPRFPERTNVQVARIEGRGVVSARVWERGVGETTASGSSAVAVAAATHGEGDVVVRFPGGDLRVRLRGERAWLTGPAEPVDESSASRDEAATSP